MRIAYFSDTFFPQINGVSNTLHYLEKYLGQNKIEYQFHVPDYDDEDLKTDPRIKRSKGIPLPDYRDCRLALPSLPRLSGCMDSFKPDLIHLVTEFGIGVTGRYYARSRRVPIVSSYHTNIDQYIRYYPSLSPLKGNIDGYFKWFHRRSRRIFVPTDDTKGRLQSIGYSNLAIWSRGIDTELFSESKRTDAFRVRYGLEGKAVVLYVGRVAAEKDLAILPETMNRVQARHANAVLVVTGDGPYLPALKAEAPAGTVFTGFLRGEQLAQAYASSDFFLTPSCTETFGNVALEAMASGLPVVAANAGGFQNFIRHGYNGYLSAPRDARGFAEAISRLIFDPVLSREMSRRAVETAKKRSWNSVFDQLIADYARALAGNRTIC